jgi:membrane protein DedA with SNARE-associated domain
LLRSPRAGAAASIVAGVVLVGWIAGEVLILSAPEARSWTEVVYAAVGLAMLILGLRAWRSERTGM